MPRLWRLGAALCWVAAGACSRPAGHTHPPTGLTTEVTSTATALDGDGDGIPDEEDKCPSEAETANGYEDDDGCPDEIRGCEFFSPLTVRVVNFPSSGDTLDTLATDALATLEDVARTLQHYPEIIIEISGHTDDRGALETNLAISTQRAEMVQNYLIERGINPERLTVVGMGPHEPVDSNETEAGRARNQRVELRILQSPVGSEDSSREDQAVSR